MTVSRRRQRERRIIVIVSVSSAIVSGLFGYSIAPPGADPLWWVLQGVVNSILIATPIVFYEVKSDRIALLRRLRRLPLVIYFTIKVLFYMAIIMGSIVLTRVAFASILSLPLALDVRIREAILFGVAMAIFGNLVFEMGGLLGFGALRNLLTGRYVQPRREQRAFLLIDMKDSTGTAERLGPVRFHELLNAFFRDVADAALECDAEIHKYVGDEAILTWPDGDASVDNDCLACPFIARDMIAANANEYRRRFGVVPAFRAALHRGEIVAGEIGDIRREIAYVGDTLNVSARLLEASKSLCRDVLVSADLLERTTLPSDLRAEPLPTLAVRGREAPLAIAALERLSPLPR